MDLKEKGAKSKGGKAFGILYVLGVAFAVTKLLDYLQWTFKLVRTGTLPEEPFFSKVDLAGAGVQMNETTYLVFATAYILMFGFILMGLIQLDKTAKLFTQQVVFKRDVSRAFKKSGNSFLAFALGTFLVDVALLAAAKTSSRFIDLISTELMVFIILGYLMYFLADVFERGMQLQEESELTI